MDDALEEVQRFLVTSGHVGFHGHAKRAIDAAARCEMIYTVPSTSFTSFMTGPWALMTGTLASILSSSSMVYGSSGRITTIILKGLGGKDISRRSALMVGVLDE